MTSPSKIEWEGVKSVLCHLRVKISDAQTALHDTKDYEAAKRQLDAAFKDSDTIYHFIERYINDQPE